MNVCLLYQEDAQVQNTCSQSVAQLANQDLLGKWTLTVFIFVLYVHSS